jgi:hypothetical protein
VLQQKSRVQTFYCKGLVAGCCSAAVTLITTQGSNNSGRSACRARQAAKWRKAPKFDARTPPFQEQCDADQQDLAS